MAAPFISLGLKATDYVADNHLHKLDDKYFHYSNYKPQNLPKVVPNPINGVRRLRRGGSKHQDDDDSEANEEDQDQDQEDRGIESEREEYIPAAHPSMTRQPLPPAGTDVEYSREPPRVRDRYIPPAALAASAGINAPYYPPPPSYSNGSVYETPISRQRRPRMQSRRSSSHPGHGRRRYASSYSSSDSEDSNYDKEMRKRKSKYFGSQATGIEPVDKAREKAHRYALKDEIRDSFTDSKAGLAGGVAGAVVAGWAASKAQVAYDKKGKGQPNALLTLLGAAVGGLAVDVVIAKFEERKAEEKEKGKDKNLGDKFDDDSDSRTRTKAAGRRKRGGGSRRDRGYDSN